MAKIRTFVAADVLLSAGDDVSALDDVEYTAVVGLVHRQTVVVENYELVSAAFLFCNTIGKCTVCGKYISKSHCIQILGFIYKVQQNT